MEGLSSQEKKLINTSIISISIKQRWGERKKGWILWNPHKKETSLKKECFVGFAKIFFFLQVGTFLLGQSPSLIINTGS